MNNSSNNNNENDLRISRTDSWHDIIERTNDFYDYLWMTPKAVKWWSATILLLVIGLIIGAMCFVPSPYKSGQPLISHFTAQDHSTTNVKQTGSSFTVSPAADSIRIAAMEQRHAEVTTNGDLYDRYVRLR